MYVMAIYIHTIYHNQKRWAPTELFRYGRRRRRKRRTRCGREWGVTPPSDAPFILHHDQGHTGGGNAGGWMLLLTGRYSPKRHVRTGREKRGSSISNGSRFVVIPTTPLSILLIRIPSKKNISGRVDSKVCVACCPNRTTTTNVDRRYGGIMRPVLGEG